ncbi:putative nuclease HARBI1 [Merluccius polli]|uniref:Nuclease HARBI1 n=1 Tax=Merluccius polli TaxID=89951 RepID=A0AA47NTF0_MERPO|nr:putative nuclease HARBI1 [Merluccius polli]
MTLFPRRTPLADRPLHRLRTRPCTDPRLSDIPPARRTLVRLRARLCTDPRLSDIPPSRRTLDRLRTRPRAPNPTLNPRRRVQSLSPLRTDPPSAAAAFSPLSPSPESPINWINCEIGADTLKTLQTSTHLQTFRLDRLLKAERRFRDRSDPLALPEDILYGRYRFSSEGIRYLVVLVGPYEGNATKRSRAQCVCVSLRFVATGTYLHTVGDAENISQKVPCDTQSCSCPKYTAKYVCGVSQLFANTNCQVASYQLFIRFPLDNQQLHMIKANFMAIAGMAGVVGAVDGTRIQIIAPSKDEDVFVNRKKVHSINTQIAFDATFNILDVAKWPAGSIRDPRILMGSGLRREAPCTSWVSCWVTGCPCKTSDTSQSTTGSTVKV